MLTKPLRYIATQEKIIFGAALLLIFIAITITVYLFLPVDVDWRKDGPWVLGVDWKGAFRPAVWRLLAGQFGDVYGHEYFNPPWVLLILLPVALLPPNVGTAVMFVLCMFGYAFAAHRMKLRWWGIAGLLINPYVFFCATNGNVDWLVALGFTLPPQIGLFFLMAKPQLGIGVAIFWLCEAWRRGKLREVIRVFAPIGIVTAICLFIFGPQMIFSSVDMRLNEFNTSYFPMFVWAGVALIYLSIKHRNIRFAIPASPLLAPYLTYHGYGIMFLGLDSTGILLATAAMHIMRHLP